MSASALSRLSIGNAMMMWKLLKAIENGQLEDANNLLDQYPELRDVCIGDEYSWVYYYLIDKNLSAMFAWVLSSLKLCPPEDLLDYLLSRKAELHDNIDTEAFRSGEGLSLFSTRTLEVLHAIYPDIQITNLDAISEFLRRSDSMKSGGRGHRPQHSAIETMLFRTETYTRLIEACASRTSLLDILRQLIKTNRVAEVYHVLPLIMKHPAVIESAVPEVCVIRWAVESGNTQLCSELLNLGFTAGRDTGLNIAIRCGDVAMVKCVHTVGLRFQAFHLMLAVASGHMPTLKFVHAAGVDLYTDRFLASDLLRYAVQYDLQSMLCFLDKHEYISPSDSASVASLSNYRLFDWMYVHKYIKYSFDFTRELIEAGGPIIDLCLNRIYREELGTGGEGGISPYLKRGDIDLAVTLGRSPVFVKQLRDLAEAEEVLN
jgi:hypothetical protein